MMTFDDVDAIAVALPGVTVGTSWGNRTWIVRGKGFAWQRPFTKADLKQSNGIIHVIDTVVLPG